MQSFTVYEHKHSEAFRVVMGKHDKPKDGSDYRVRVYQGSNDLDAAQAARSNETRADIREQILRFIPVSEHAKTKCAYKDCRATESLSE